jgi:hypothetical protein
MEAGQSDKAKAQDTLPYLASASLYAGAFSCGYPGTGLQRGA